MLFTKVDLWTTSTPHVVVAAGQPGAVAIWRQQNMYIPPSLATLFSLSAVLTPDLVVEKGA